jgi:hypothetical protein
MFSDLSVVQYITLHPVIAHSQLPCGLVIAYFSMLRICGRHHYEHEYDVSAPSHWI